MALCAIGQASVQAIVLPVPGDALSPDEMPAGLGCARRGYRTGDLPPTTCPYFSDPKAVSSSQSSPAGEPRPKAIQFVPERIPEELRDIPAWVCWQFELRRGTWAKVPVNCLTSEPAKINDPASLGTFQDAVERCRLDGYDGIGLCRTADLVFIDLDGCRNPDTGEIAGWPWVRDILGRINGRAYVEVSVSGKGVHIVAKGTLLEGRRQWSDHAHKHVGFAFYDGTRYFTFTGHVLPESGALVDVTAELTDLHAVLFANRVLAPRAKDQRVIPANPVDSELKIKMTRPTFARLWRGDWTGYPSQSEADLALCRFIARQRGPDGPLIDKLFRQSGT